MKLKTFKFETVTSTNDIAMNLIKKEKEETGCIYAYNQTKGRGTRGKKWISEIGNFFGSFFFQLKKNYPPFNEFLTINTVIVSDIIRKFCIGKKISLKWPNDIFVNGKKICGILQEVIVFNNKKFLIVGVGINVVSNPNIVKGYKTTNIFAESKIKPSIKEITEMMIESYEKFFNNLHSYDYNSYKKKANSISLRI